MRHWRLRHHITPAGMADACTFCYHVSMQKRHQKTLQALFRQPTSGTVAFADIEALILALGGEVLEREGSRK